MARGNWLDLTRRLDERAVPEFVHRLNQLLLRVHHDRPVPGDRLGDRPAGNQQETDAAFARLHRHLVAGAEDHERAVAALVADEMVLIAEAFLDENAERLGGVAERTRSLGCDSDICFTGLMDMGMPSSGVCFPSFGEPPLSCRRVELSTDRSPADVVHLRARGLSGNSQTRFLFA
jgi:hypothetical protein